MTSWTAPRTWSSEVLTSALLNTHLRDNELHLKELIPTGISPADRAGVGGAGTSEEWDSTTTGLTWSPSSPTTVDSNTTVAGHLYVSTQADGTERLGTKSWSPAGAFDVRLGGVVLASAASSLANIQSQFGLHIGNSDNSVRILLQILYTYDTRAAVAQAYTYTGGSYTQRGANVTLANNLPIYLRIMRDGSNNLSFYYSQNGMLYNWIADQAHTLTVANIGIRAVANTTAGFQGVADWLRTDV